MAKCFWSILGAACLLVGLVLTNPAFAKDWSSSPYHNWYNEQKLTPETKERLGVGWNSCCLDADRFDTRFRIVDDGSKYGSETYEYLKDGQWLRMPPDIVQHKPTPDGQPILFLRASNAEPLCFIIDQAGR